MESCHIAVPVKAQKYNAKQQIAPAIALCQECILRYFCDTNDRYLEELEAKLVEQTRLQSRVQELEGRLREFDPSMSPYSRSNTSQQFLTPPETVNPQLRSSGYLSPRLDMRNQPHSPRYQNYSDGRSPDSSPVYSSIGHPGDQDTNTDPGLFEIGDAGKGWYLGSASGSNSILSSKLTL